MIALYRQKNLKENVCYKYFSENLVMCSDWDVLCTVLALLKRTCKILNAAFFSSLSPLPPQIFMLYVDYLTSRCWLLVTFPKAWKHSQFYIVHMHMTLMIVLNKSRYVKWAYMDSPSWHPAYYHYLSGMCLCSVHVP